MPPLQGIGHSLSGYASLILRSDEAMGPDKPGDAFPVHPDSLQLLSKESAAQANPPNSPRVRTAQDDWYERLNSDVRTPTKPASFPATMQTVDLTAPLDLCHLAPYLPAHICYATRMEGALLRTYLTVQPGSNKSIRVQMEMDGEGHCTCDGYMCAPSL